MSGGGLIIPVMPHIHDILSRDHWPSFEMKRSMDQTSLQAETLIWHLNTIP